ncbi:MAG TPA: EVE domain-containing protein [Phycisphaerae bacterium]|nr:EVE domain-containing protein [Phycisphaerae bacterium]
MPYWLLKTEPTDYSFADLLRDGETPWEGVTNPAAVNNLKAMKKGDQVMLYHTGKQKAVVGLAKVVHAQDGAVTIKPGRPLARPITLAQIKQHQDLAAWPLVRIGRLSVVPVTATEWETVLQMERHP